MSGGDIARSLVKVEKWVRVIVEVYERERCLSEVYKLQTARIESTTSCVFLFNNSVRFRTRDMTLV